MFVNTVGKTSYGEDIPLGQEREIDGVKKYWSGQNYGFQTNEQYQKLTEEGYFAGRTGDFNPIHEAVFGGEAAARYISSGKELVKGAARLVLPPEQRSDLRSAVYTGAEKVAEAIDAVPGASETLEALETVTQESAKALNIGVPQTEFLTDLMLGGAGKAKGAKTLGDLVPERSLQLQPVGVSARGRIRYTPQVPDNVMRINADQAGAFGRADLPSAARKGEAIQADRALRIEQGKSPMATTEAQRRRLQRAIFSTNYMVSNPLQWAKDATEAAKMGINWHHVGDLALTGDVGIALDGTDKFGKVVDLLNKRYLKRIGNDSINAMLVPMGFDHQGLLHKKYYPKLSSRQNLEKVVKSGEIKNWSPKRIAGLLNIVLEDQQEIVIGWAKWKTAQIKKAHPELKTTAQIKEFVQNNGDYIREIGKGEEILDVDKIRKFGAPSGAVRNTSNKQIREIWGINFGSRAAQQGLEHTIPSWARKPANPKEPTRPY